MRAVLGAGSVIISLIQALESAAAHVSGCSAVALDPRGHYLVSGGNDSIVNFFDTAEWICARTIASCE